MKVDVLKINDIDLKSGDFEFWLENFYNIDGETISNKLYYGGSSFNNFRLNERKFLLNGTIKDNLHQNMSILSAIFAKGTIKKLTVGLPGMPVRNIFISIENTGMADYSYPLVGEISYQVKACDPYLYSLDEDIESITLGAQSNVALTFPIVFPAGFTFGDIVGGEGTINNAGNVEAYPVITISGICDSITITNETTGESLGCNISINDGSHLVIDCRPETRGIYYNGNKRMDLKSTADEWPTCAPGDNVFRFTRNSAEIKEHCKVELRARWI